MKASDLQIGDLVRYEMFGEATEIGRIVELRRTSMQHHIMVDAMCFESTDYHGNVEENLKGIQPLPLTHETFEESGFVMFNDEYNEAGFLECDYILKGFTGEFDEISRIKVVIHRDGMCNYFAMTKEIDGQSICKLRYVHELQHYLRLIGVRNEVFYSDATIKAAMEKQEESK